MLYTIFNGKLSNTSKKLLPGKGTFARYIMKFPDGKYYIGISQNIKSRMARYRNFTGPRSVDKAIDYFGIENVHIKIIGGYGSWEELNEVEKKHIVKYNSFELGYNSTKGGSGTLGVKRPDLAKRNKIITQKGKPKTQEHKDKISKANMGRKGNIGKINGRYKGGLVHGTSNCYRHMPCRCTPCKQANNKVAVERRRAIKEEGRINLHGKGLHGTTKGFKELGCPCKQCENAYINYLQNNK